MTQFATIGAGTVGQAIAGHIVRSFQDIVLSNSGTAARLRGANR